MGHEEVALELALGAQEAGVQKLHDRPQVAHVVFDRRSGQGDAVVGFQRPCGPRLPGLWVLDVLGLVQHDAAPLHLPEELEVPLHQSVAGDDDGVPSRLPLERRSSFPAGAVVDQHGESGSKAGGLLLPVVYHGGWADEEDRPFAVGLPITLGQRQGLNRLALAHVVGQARPQAPLPQERKPRIAADLVGPKCAAEALRRRKLLERRLPIQLLQQLSDPAGGLDAVEVEPLRRVLGLERHLDDVSHGRFLGALLLPEIDRRLNLRGVHLHPLTADPDQRGLHSRKRLQLAEGELPVSEGHFPIELDNRLQRQTAPSLHLRALDFGPRTTSRTFVPLRVHQAGSITP